MRRWLAAVLLVLVTGCSVQVGAGETGGSNNGRGGDGGDAVNVGQDETSVGIDGEDGTSGVGIDIRIGDP
jgi:hypothetical protein